MTCASCAARIEKKLNRLEGVSATVNYATEKATVQFGGGDHARRRLIATIERTGYGATLPADGRARSRCTSVRVLRRRTDRLRGAQPAGDRAGDGAGVAVRLVAVDLLAADACRWSAGRAGPSTGPPLRNLMQGNASMDTLISLGTAGRGRLVGVRAAVRRGRARSATPTRSSSGWSGTAGRPTSTSRRRSGITTFLLLGRYLEARAKRRSGAALRGPAGACCRAR